MIDYQGIAVILGVTIISVGMLWLLFLKTILTAIKDAYAYGEASAFRKQADMPPIHTDGPIEPVDLGELMANQFPGGDEMDDVGEPEPESDEVRVNMSGPRVVEQDD